jgi:F0F1-type ATP synthase assembly protein I
VVTIRRFDHDRRSRSQRRSTPVHRREHTPGQDLFGLGERERQAALAWVGENLTQVRRSVYEQRLLHRSLWIGFVVGLATYVGGYLLKSSVTTEPLGLVADLLYGLGYALWTGVVVVVFVQIFPEAKRRQFKQALDAYEAAQRDEARAGSDQASGDDGVATAR